MDEMVSTRIDLPRDMVDLLKRHSEAQGFTLAQQILAILYKSISRQSQGRKPSITKQMSVATPMTLMRYPTPQLFQQLLISRQ